MEIDNTVTGLIIGAAIEVHRNLGPGLMEKIYEECLFRELELQGVPTKRQVPIPVIYKGENLGIGMYLDLVVEDSVIVELKAVARLEPIHTAQLLTYMKLSNKKLGLLLNFNVPVLKDGIKRYVL